MALFRVFLYPHVKNGSIFCGSVSKGFLKAYDGKDAKSRVKTLVECPECGRLTFIRSVEAEGQYTLNFNGSG